ncbi:MAG: DUF4249 domain-containing protein [Bacteroidia bacterium]|nr:DUF4249 domain-containing protein [Bacteroidia bacterium]
MQTARTFRSFFRLALLPGIALALHACIPDPVAIEIPQAEPKLVVASQMLPGNFLLVNVSRSFGALEYAQDQSDTLSDDLLERILADSARVVLSWPGGRDTLLGVGAGTYIGSAELIPDETYTLEVFDSLSGASVSAIASVLPPVALDSVRWRYNIRETAFGDTTFRDTLIDLIIEFTDPAGPHAYMLNAYRVRVPDSNALTNLFNTGTGIPTIALNDRLFTSPVYRDTITYDAFRPGDTLAVALSSISQTYYDFLTARQRSGTSIFALLLREPISFPSNIQGGYGFFNLHLPSLRLLITE